MLANIHGTTIFYEVAGEGLPLVFIHGLGATSNVWNAQRVALARYFKVVTLDLPGSGRSAKSERQYSMERWVEQLAALADAARLDNFVLIGHSMSTMLAQKFAAKYGNRLTGLVLCGPLTELPPAGKEAMLKRAETVLREGMLPVADVVVTGGLTTATREGNAALAGLMREVLAANDPACYAGHCHALASGSAKADQAQIKCPTLILEGDQDGVTPLSNARAIAAAIPGARIRIIPATAHLTMLERPEAFNAALTEFLAGL
jgi:pimeloyl-ACP methyl ester carboxylesterase